MTDDVYKKLIEKSPVGYVEKNEVIETNVLLEAFKTLLDSLPHPAMLIQGKGKVVLAANKIALDIGVKIGGHCWREFGKTNYISDEDKEIANQYPDFVPVELGIKCTFCRGDKCFLEESKQNDPCVAAFGKMWDTYWIRCSEDVYLHYAVDISESKQAEDKLRKSEEALKEAQCIAKLGRWEFDHSTNNLSWSDTIFKIFEINQDEFDVSYQAFLKVVHPADRIKVDLVWNDSLKNQLPCELEHRLFMKNGQIKWVSEKFDTTFNEQGHPVITVGIVQDITRRKQTEEELVKSRERFENAIQGTNAGTWEWNVQSGETVFNDRWAEIIGYTLEEIAPTSIETFRRFTHPEDLMEAEGILKQVFVRELDYYDVECRMKHKDGSWVWIQDSGKVTSWTSDGKPLMMSGTHIDITNRKQLENVLFESETKLKTMVSNISDVIGIMDQNGIMKYKSPNIEKWFGWLPEDLVGTDGWNTVHPNDLEWLQKEFHKILCEDNATVTVEYRYKCKDGSYKMIELTAVNLINNEHIKGVLLNYHDITERKKLKDELRKSEKRLLEAQKMAHIGNWVLDLQTNEMWASEEAFNIYGIERVSAYLPLSVVKKSVFSEYRELLDSALTELIKKNRDYDVKFKISDGRTGEERYVHSKAKLICDDFDNAIKVAGTIQDISSFKKAELEILKAKDAAEEASAAKSQFLANMSHEIRTPLNGVLGMLQLMQLTELTEEQQEYIHICRTSADGLLVVINDILDYSKIASGKMELVKAAFSIKDLMNSAVSMFMHSAREKGLIIEVSIENDVPDELIGDHFRLRQIIINLVGNAVKFSDDGRIEVTVKKIESGSDEEKEIEGRSFESFGGRSSKEIMLEFLVKDTGIGIPTEKIELLFTSFSQVDASNTRTYGGSGLGLAISKSLVELMRGKIWVDSIDGEGSSFYFTCVLGKVDILSNKGKVKQEDIKQGDRYPV